MNDWNSLADWVEQAGPGLAPGDELRLALEPAGWLLLARREHGDGWVLGLARPAGGEDEGGDAAARHEALLRQGAQTRWTRACFGALDEDATELVLADLAALPPAGQAAGWLRDLHAGLAPAGSMVPAAPAPALLLDPGARA